MKQQRIWLTTPRMGDHEQSFIQAAFERNLITSGGENVTRFESALAVYLEQDHVVAVNSGTSALHLALLLIGVQRGDEVLCQSMTFIASANPIVYLGATPIFIDSEKMTWNLCPIALEEAILDRLKKGKKPKCIVAVCLYGMPFQVEAIQIISDTYGIPIVEDSAAALGSRYKGKLCGGFGTIGIFSFNGSKVITTSSGGALVVDTVQLKKQAHFLAAQAKDPAPHYQHRTIGYNYQMSSISAAIGSGQLLVLQENLDLRNAVHSFYDGLFSTCEVVSLLKNPTDAYDSNYWMNTILVDSENKRSAIALALEKENIESRPLVKPLHLQPVFATCPYYGGTVSEELFRSGLCLPSSSNLTVAEQDRIAAVFIKTLLL